MTFLIRQALMILTTFMVMGISSEAEAMFIQVMAPVALLNETTTTHESVIKSQKQDWGDIHKYHPYWDRVWD